MFKINVFYKTIDIVHGQIKSRFERMREISQLFSFLHPQKLLKLKDHEVSIFAETLIKKYKNDISSLFEIQLQLFKKTFFKELENSKSISNLVEIILAVPDLISSFNEVISVLFLFLSIPITSASAERTFSKLKLIKNYLRTTMSQHRLSSLSILAIEAEAAKNLDTAMIIKKFAADKCRKVSF